MTQHCKNSYKKLFQLTDHEVHIWSIALSSLTDIADLESVLSNEERVEAGRFRFEIDQRRSVISRGMLRVILGKYLDIQPQEIKFSYNPHDKPLLQFPNMKGKLWFNVSHSKDYIVYVLTRANEIGVDIEYINLAFATKEIASQFFSLAEIKAFNELPIALQPQAFFSCWTRKEAFIKAVGEGLSYSLKDFDVTLKPGDPARLIEIRRPGMNASEWSLYDIEVERGYKAALAVHDHPTRILYRNFADLILA